MMINTRRAASPGAILKQDYMLPLGLTVEVLAQELHIPANQLQEVLDGKRPVRAGLALRLGRYFGVNPETWLNLQANYELWLAQRDLGRKVEQLVAPFEAA
jgi:addiction module HigA family antidote